MKQPKGLVIAEMGAYSNPKSTEKVSVYDVLVMRLYGRNSLAEFSIKSKPSNDALIKKVTAKIKELNITGRVSVTLFQI